MIETTTTSREVTMDSSFQVIVQDETDFNFQVVADVDSMDDAQLAIETLVAEMDVVTTDPADLKDAAASIDLDGHVRTASWITVAGSDIRSLVAIVEVI
jgi:3-dehydroquinate synthase class II